MKKEKKCSNCGSAILKPAAYSFVDSNGVMLPIDIYVCEECGYIELFENKDKGPYIRKSLLNR